MFKVVNAVMKRTGICPKCGSNKIKENTLGGFNTMYAGRVYRCNECGFSEIWSTPSDRKQINTLVIAIIVGSLAMLGLVYTIIP